MTSGKVGIGIGWILGMACAIVPLYFLIIERQGVPSPKKATPSATDQAPPDFGNFQPPSN